MWDYARYNVKTHRLWILQSANEAQRGQYRLVDREGNEVEQRQYTRLLSLRRRGLAQVTHRCSVRAVCWQPSSWWLGGETRNIDDLLKGNVVNLPDAVSARRWQRLQ